MAFLIFFLVTKVPGQVNVTTYHNDNARTGQNLKETVLNPANVNANLFGQLFSQDVDSYIYAQPLYLSYVTIPNLGVHNVIYVVTQHDTVYAFDADSNTGANATPLWQLSFINPAAGITTLSASDLSCGDIPPEVGILGTPVLSVGTQTLYVVARTKETGVFYQRLHALDATSGAEKFGGPIVIQASVKGTGSGSIGGVIAFDPLRQNQRAGLLLQNGMVYITWGSECDVAPYHGWVMAYGATTLKQQAVWVTTPHGDDGAIWQAGAAPAGDSSFNTYVTTGNGTFDADSGGVDYGDSVLRLSPPSAGTLPVADYFTPYDQASLNNSDTDLGASGPVLLPLQPPGSPHRNLLVQTGKDGTIYLIDRNHMGHFNALNNSQIVQTISGAIGKSWSTPAWWNSNLYVGPTSDSLASFSFNTATGLFLTVPSSRSAAVFNFPGSTPSISANGTANGIMWALQEDGYRTHGNTILHAYDATNLANELYNSNQNPVRDSAGAAVKFAVPTIANGKVYVGSENRITVYGLLPADFIFAVTPASTSVKAGNYATFSVSVTSQGGYAGTVNLSVTGLPAAATASFTPSTITANGTSVFKIMTTASTPAGAYSLTVTGQDSGGSLIHSTNVTLTVHP